MAVHKSAITIVNRMGDYVGAITTGNFQDFDSLVANAFNSIIDIVGDENRDFLERHCGEETQTTTSINSIADKKVLRVMRDAGSSTYFECKKVERLEFEHAGQSNSLHQSDTLTPVFHISQSNDGSIDLRVRPALSALLGNDALITYVDYFYKDLDVDDTIAAAHANLPAQMEEALILAACRDFMVFRLADMSIDEEDNDVVVLYQTQLKSIDTKLNKELERLKLAE